MPQVDFYLLPTSDEGSRLRMVCRTTEKAFSLGHRVHIHTGSQALSARLDELLWTFRDRSFVPHCIAPHSAEPWPVTVGHDWDPDHGDVLVNLAPRAPACAERFARIVEVVDQSPEVQSQGRGRYRAYRELGCTLHHHRLGH